MAERWNIVTTEPTPDPEPEPSDELYTEEKQAHRWNVPAGTTYEGDNVFVGPQGPTGPGMGTSVVDYGATGDGVTDDAAAIQAAFDAESAIFFPPGTYLIGTALDVPSGVSIRGLGEAVVKKADSFTGDYAIDLAGDLCTIADLEVDGNRTGSAGGAGLRSSGTGNVARDVYSHSHYDAGVESWGTGSLLTCYRVRSDDNVKGNQTANGFYAPSGVLRLYDCEASGNDNSGVYLASAADAGCHVDGRFDDNYNSGVRIFCDDGTIGHLSLNHNRAFGLLFDYDAGGAQRWNADTVIADWTGDSTSWGDNVSGTSVELYNVDRSAFGTVICKRQQGYGLALGGGSTHNSFGSVMVDNTGAADGDPGLHLSASSAYNSFGFVHIVAETYAIIIGEGISPKANDYNTFGTVHAEGCENGVVRIDAGQYNHFTTVVARNCYTVEEAGDHKGILDFTTADTAYNIVEFLDHLSVTTEPYCLIWNDGGAHHNVVLNGFSRDFSGVNIGDYGANNSFTLSL